MELTPQLANRVVRTSRLIFASSRRTIWKEKGARMRRAFGYLILVLGWLLVAVAAGLLGGTLVSLFYWADLTSRLVQTLLTVVVSSLAGIALVRWAWSLLDTPGGRRRKALGWTLLVLGALGILTAGGRELEYSSEAAKSFDLGISGGVAVLGLVLLALPFPHKSEGQREPQQPVAQASVVGSVEPALPAPPPRPLDQGNPRRNWLWVVIGIVALSALGAAVRASMRDADEPSAQERAFGAEEPLSGHDEAVFSTLHDHLRRYNHAYLPLLIDYLDPGVSARKWVRTAGGHIREMRLAATAMRTDIVSVEDDGLRGTLLPLADVLEDEVAAFTELRLAVAGLDIEAERRAMRQVRAASEERRRVGAEWFDRLRPYVDAATIEQILREAAAA